MIGLVYMRIFLKDSVPGGGMRQPLLKEAEEPCLEQCADDSSNRTTGTFKKLPSLGDVICLLKCRYLRQKYLLNLAAIEIDCLRLSYSKNIYANV